LRDAIRDNGLKRRKLSQRVLLAIKTEGTFPLRPERKERHNETRLNSRARKGHLLGARSGNSCGNSRAETDISQSSFARTRNRFLLRDSLPFTRPGEGRATKGRFSSQAYGRMCRASRAARAARASLSRASVIISNFVRESSFNGSRGFHHPGKFALRPAILHHTEQPI